MAIQGPGANLNPNPQALAEALKCLAPNAAANRQLLNNLKAYVFPLPWQASPSRQETRQHLQRALEAEGQEHLDTLLTMLEGMKAIMEYYKLQSPEELDSYLEAHKEMFRRCLLNKAGRKPTGRPGKTF